MKGFIIESHQPVLLEKGKALSVIRLCAFLYKEEYLNNAINTCTLAQTFKYFISSMDNDDSVLVKFVFINSCDLDEEQTK